VDQADLHEAAVVSLAEVLVDDGGDVARLERMQVEPVLDGDADRLVVGVVDGQRVRGAARPSGARPSAGSSRDTPPRACTVRR
jgi:hypothetical protein